MNENQLTIITDDGNEELATILFTHEENGKNYVVFEFEETGDISAAIFEEDENGEGKLLDIETDEEWDMLDKLLDVFFAEEEDDEEDLADEE